MVPGSSPCRSLGVSVSYYRPQPKMWVQWTHYPNHMKSAYQKSNGSRFLQVSNDFDSEWICSRATRMWQCQANTPGGTVQGHPDAKGSPWKHAKWWPWAEECSAYTFPMNIFLNYRVKPTGMEIKAIMQPSVLTAPFPIFTSITSPGWTHPYSDTSQKNCKRGSLWLLGG